MKDYGREPDTDVREMVKSEIVACEFAASEKDSQAADYQAKADKNRADAAMFRAACANLQSQLAAINAVLGEVVA